MFRDFEPHFEEIRRRLLISFLVFFLGMVFCYFFAEKILNSLILPLKVYDPNITLYFQKPYEAFLVRIKIACSSGLILVSPFLFSQGWLFLAPGLYPQEKKMVLPLIFISTTLFLVGVWFAYTWVVPWGMHFLLSYQTEGLRPMIGAAEYFSFLTSMLFAFGILFDFPVLIIGLVKVGILQTQTLKTMRKGIILAIFIVSAVLTPSPDPLSQLLLAIPLWILFEISVLIAGSIESKNHPKY